jgi:hypothetical protein
MRRIPKNVKIKPQEIFLWAISNGKLIYVEYTPNNKHPIPLKQIKLFMIILLVDYWLCNLLKIASFVSK